MARQSFLARPHPVPKSREVRGPTSGRGYGFLYRRFRLWLVAKSGCGRPRLRISLPRSKPIQACCLYPQDHRQGHALGQSLARRPRLSAAGRGAGEPASVSPQPSSRLVRPPLAGCAAGVKFLLLHLPLLVVSNALLRSEPSGTIKERWLSTQPLESVCLI